MSDDKLKQEMVEKAREYLYRRAKPTPHGASEHSLGPLTEENLCEMLADFALTQTAERDERIAELNDALRQTHKDYLNEQECRVKNQDNLRLALERVAELERELAIAIKDTAILLERVFRLLDTPIEILSPSAPRKAEASRYKAALRKLITDKEPNGYPLWFNRAVYECSDCDLEDLCRMHLEVAERDFAGCEAEIEQFEAALNQNGGRG